jgi:hypothetical protein
VKKNNNSLKNLNSYNYSNNVIKSKKVNKSKTKFIEHKYNINKTNKLDKNNNKNVILSLKFNTNKKKDLKIFKPEINKTVNNRLNIFNINRPKLNIKKIYKIYKKNNRQNIKVILLKMELKLFKLFLIKSYKLQPSLYKGLDKKQFLFLKNSKFIITNINKNFIFLNNLIVINEELNITNLNSYYKCNVLTFKQYSNIIANSGSNLLNFYFFNLTQNQKKNVNKIIKFKTNSYIFNKHIKYNNIRLNKINYNFYKDNISSIFKNKNFYNSTLLNKTINDKFLNLNSKLLKKIHYLIDIKFLQKNIKNKKILFSIFINLNYHLTKKYQVLINYFLNLNLKNIYFYQVKSKNNIKFIKK